MKSRHGIMALQSFSDLVLTEQSMAVTPIDSETMSQILVTTRGVCHL